MNSTVINRSQTIADKIYKIQKSIKNYGNRAHKKI